MKEIKFRVWTGNTMEYNVMVGKFGAFFVNPGAKGDGIHPNDSASLTPFTTIYGKETPVMQFTGLKDKNGKEIYEGDVVDIQHPCWSENCSVEFSNGSFIFRGLNGLSKDVIVPGYTFMRETWKVEVVGNIYENPELISTKTQSPL